MGSDGQGRERDDSASETLPPVPLADLERAAAIARGVRSGRIADRRATLEQLLEAFGEPQASPRALRRIDAALRHVGVRTTPSVHDAAAGFPLMLSVGPARRAPLQRPAAMVAAAIVALVVLIALGRALGGDEEPGVTLPAGTTATTTAAPAPAETTATAPATTETTPPEAPLVSLTLEPEEPGFACAIDQDRKVLFRGVLDEPVTVEAERIRALVTAPAVAVAHERRQRLPGRRIVLVGETRLKVLLDGPSYCEEEES